MCKIMTEYFHPDEAEETVWDSAKEGQLCGEIEQDTLLPLQFKSPPPQILFLNLCHEL